MNKNRKRLSLEVLYYANVYAIIYVITSSICTSKYSTHCCIDILYDNNFENVDLSFTNLLFFVFGVTVVTSHFDKTRNHESVDVTLLFHL